MAATDPAFKAIVHALLSGTAVPGLLASRSAVVLERIARGGGATRWYHCPGAAALGAIEEKLSPGSVTSFYFDGRIRRARPSPAVVADIEKIIAEAGDAVLGTLREDGIGIAGETIVSSGDLRETLSTIDPSTEVFYGAFPGRDDDGVAAVTVTLPDRDGVVRAHPH